MKAPKITVAHFLNQQIALCGKTQKEIASELGYPNPNIITMFKKGVTKVPLSIVGRLAAAVDADPAHLLRLALEEYEPNLLAVLQDILATGTIVTEDEAAVLVAVRTARKSRRIDISQPWARRMLQDTIEAIAETSELRANASVDAMERLPRNARVKPPS